MSKEIHCQMLLDYPGETKMDELLDSFDLLVKKYGDTQIIDTSTGAVVYEARLFRSFKPIEKWVFQEAAKINPELVDEKYW